MIYILEYVDLVNNNYVTLNRGDILGTFCATDPSIVIFRVVKNERDF